MKLVIPSNWQPDLVERVRGPEAFTVYAALPSTVAGGGRPSALVPAVSKRQAKAHIDEVHAAGMEFEYTLNAATMNNQEFTRRGQRQLHKLLQWIDESGVDCVTVAIPFLLDIIKRTYPRLRVNVSTIANVDGPHRAKYWQDMGADSICISVIGVGRSFKTIRAIRKAVDIELAVIANLTCAYQCPYTNYHNVIEAHASQRGHSNKGFFVDYCRTSCVNKNMARPENLVRASWIRPEDVHVYEEMGIERIKLVNRMMPTDQIGRIVDAYRARRYDGNLFDLMDYPPKPIQAFEGTRGFVRMARTFARPDLVNIRKLRHAKPEPVAPDAFYLDNSKLNGFVEHFAKLDCSDRTCDDCRYCDTVAARHLQVDEETRVMIADKTGELLDGLIGGDLFR